MSISTSPPLTWIPSSLGVPTPIIWVVIFKLPLVITKSSAIIPTDIASVVVISILPPSIFILPLHSTKTIPCVPALMTSEPLPLIVRSPSPKNTIPANSLPLTPLTVMLFVPAKTMVSPSAGKSAIIAQGTSSPPQPSPL